MVRTTLSFCVLFGCLIAGLALLQQPSAKRSPKAAPASRETSPETTLRSARKLSLLAVPEKTCSAEDFGVMLISHNEVVVSDEQPAPAEKSAEEKSTEDKESKPDEPVIRNSLRGEEPNANSSKPEDSSIEDDKPVEPLPLDRLIEERPQLTPELLALREKLRDALAFYYQQPENVASRSPWGAMHAMIAYGVDTELIAQNRKVNAIGYLCFNGNCNGQTLFWVQNGRLQTKIGPGVQGHAGQFLAMLAQSRVRTDYPMKVDGYDFKVADLIAHEKHTCQPRTELTFKLIALVHYLKSDERWKSFDGQDWDIPRLIKEELNQPIVGAACGGTHRLTGFSYAVRKRQQRKEPMVGQWERANKFIRDYHEYTFKLQNPDGSFSTNWFESRGDEGPPSRRLETTGHITEWLAFSLSEDELKDPRMVKSVTYLTDLLLDGRSEKWSIGPLGHGLHALAIYDERVFGGKPGERSEELARNVRPLMLRRK